MPRSDSTFYKLHTGQNRSARRHVVLYARPTEIVPIRYYEVEQRGMLTQCRPHIDPSRLEFTSKTHSGKFEVVPWCCDACVFREDAWLKLPEEAARHFFTARITLRSTTDDGVEPPPYLLVYPRFVVECHNAYISNNFIVQGDRLDLRHFYFDATRIPPDIHALYPRYAYHKAIVSEMIREHMLAVGAKERNFIRMRTWSWHSPSDTDGYT
jgi:hypothetical protein